MVHGDRNRRLADRIKVILAERLEKGLRDPRMGFATITEVRVTGDLQHATVFFTVYGSDQERADTVAALTAATGMLRTEVGRGISTRLVPTLEFVLDALPGDAMALEEVLREARERDAHTAALAASAQYAGDSDPYVKPRQVEAEPTTREASDASEADRF